MKTRAPVAVIGAGLAGLTAAAYLRRHRIPVRVFEASPHLAGLARSFENGDGFTYDFGAHFITNRLAAAVGYAAHCTNVPRYGEAFWLAGRPCRYPFGILTKPRFVASALASRLRLRKEVHTAADWFRGKYGRALANEVAIPLTEAWSGAAAEDLSPAVGDKIPSSLLKTLMLRLSGRLTSRTVAIGYCHTLPESPHVWHVYPRGGVGAMCQHIAEEVRDCIETQSPVEAILTDDGRATGVRVRGQDIPASAVVSTAPAHILAKLVQGAGDALQPLAKFRYRPMVFVNMRFEGRGLLPEVVLWTPGKEFPFFRLTETPLSMPWMAPAGKTMITADLGCQVGDEIWKMEDEQLGKLCSEHLQKIIPDALARYDGCRVLRTPLAYPVFLNEYEEERQRFEETTGIAGLYSVGRNGEFAHILMEDVYWRTRRKMRKLAADLLS